MVSELSFLRLDSFSSPPPGCLLTHTHTHSVMDSQLSLTVYTLCLHTNTHTRTKSFGHAHTNMRALAYVTGSGLQGDYYSITKCGSKMSLHPSRSLFLPLSCSVSPSLLDLVLELLLFLQPVLHSHPPFNLLPFSVFYNTSSGR